VWGEGNPSASLAIVGIAPADEEIRKGRVFAGGSGRILDNSCLRTGVSRGGAYITNIVKCHVPSGETLHWKAVKQCSTLLWQELNSLPNLKAILTLGEPTFHAFSGKKLTTVTNRKKPDSWLRGCPYPFGAGKVIIPTQHPAYHARTGFTTAYQFDLDLAKAQRFANGQGRISRQLSNYTPTDMDVRDALTQIREYGRGGLDIETPEDADEDELAAGGRPLPIELIGVSPDVDTTIGLRPPQYHLLLPFLQDHTHPIRWYTFNAGFDFYHIGKLCTGPLSGVVVRDVMLHLNVWRSDLIKKDLGIALSFFSDLPYTKNLMRIDPVRYNWADTCGVLEAGLNLEAVLELQGLLQVSLLQDHPLIYDLTGQHPDGLNKLRELGVRTDLREVFRFLKISQETLGRYQQVWNTHFPSIDWTSPQQLSGLFTQVFKLPVIMRQRVKKKEGLVVRTKTPTCDVDALEEYRDKYQNKTAGLVLAMRTIKHLGDFAGIIRPDTNRIHTGYAIHRQIQRRIQAFDPNIQTLPEELAGFQTRRMVVPDNLEEDEILTIDASQIELRIYAWLSNAQNLLRAMESGEYIYAAMYRQIFHRPYYSDPDGPKTKSNRASYVTPQEILAAKSGPLGFIYDRGAQSLVDKLGMSPQLAYQVHAEFHRQNPEIRTFHTKVDTDVAKKGYQDNLWGARRYFPTGRGQRTEYLSFHGQSNGGDFLRAQYLIPAFKHLADFGARVLLTVHDSMAINSPKRNSRAIAQFLYDHAEAPIPQMNGFVIPCEVKHGPNWADCKAFETRKEGGRTIVL